MAGVLNSTAATAGAAAQCSALIKRSGWGKTHSVEAVTVAASAWWHVQPLARSDGP
jgi:hypothetical protein